MTTIAINAAYTDAEWAAMLDRLDQPCELSPDPPWAAEAVAETQRRKAQDAERERSAAKRRYRGPRLRVMRVTRPLEVQVVNEGLTVEQRLALKAQGYKLVTDGIAYHDADHHLRSCAGWIKPVSGKDAEIAEADWLNTQSWRKDRIE